MRTALLLSAVLIAAVPAQARSKYGVDVRIKIGKRTYEHFERLKLGKSTNYTGRAEEVGGRSKWLILNVLPVVKKSGRIDLQFQLEIGGSRKKRGQLQLQGEVMLEPGKKLTVVRGEGYRVAMTLRGGRLIKVKKRSVYENENVLFETRVHYKGALITHRQIYAAATQSTFIGRVRAMDGKRVMTVNILPDVNIVQPSSSINVQYQIGLGRKVGKGGGKAVFQVQGQTVLKPSKSKLVEKGKNWTLSFRAEVLKEKR